MAASSSEQTSHYSDIINLLRNLELYIVSCNPEDGSFKEFISLNEAKELAKSLNYLYAEADLDVDKLNEILKKRWELVQGSCLSYTASPNSPQTRLCQKIAFYLNYLDDSKRVYQYLMPSMTQVEESTWGMYEENIDDYPLSKLIVSDDGLSLIPAEMLFDIALDREDTIENFNKPYCLEDMLGQTTEWLSKRERQALITHTKESKYYYDASMALIKARTVGVSIGAELSRFIKKLRAGGKSEGRTEGATELQAAQVSYNGLTRFHQFWMALDEATRLRVGGYTSGSSSVSIQKIIDVLTHKEEGLTCVEVNANSLERILREHAELYDEDAKSQDVIALKGKEVQELKQQALESNDRYEKLSLTMPLLRYADSVPPSVIENAIKRGEKDTFEFFVENKVSYSFSEFSLKLMFLSAIVWRNLPALNSICDNYTANGNEILMKTGTALHIAIIAGSMPIIMKILSLPGIDVNVENEKGITPVFAAYKRKKYTAVIELLSHPEIKPNHCSFYRESLLSMAVNNNDYGIVKLLLENPTVNINEYAAFQYNILHSVAKREDSSMLQILLSSRDADLNRSDYAGNSVLHYIYEKKHFEIYDHAIFSRHGVILSSTERKTVYSMIFKYLQDGASYPGSSSLIREVCIGFLSKYNGREWAIYNVPLVVLCGHLIQLHREASFLLGSNMFINVFKKHASNIPLFKCIAEDEKLQNFLCEEYWLSAKRLSNYNNQCEVYYELQQIRNASSSSMDRTFQLVEGYHEYSQSGGLSGLEKLSDYSNSSAAKYFIRQHGHELQEIYHESGKNDHDHCWQIGFIGANFSGKTSLQKSFRKGHCPNVVKQMLQHKLSSKTSEYWFGKVKWLFWDNRTGLDYLTGTKLRDSLSVYNGSTVADGIVLVFDITNRDTFIRLKEKYKTLIGSVHSCKGCVLVGTKADLEAKRAVTFREAKLFADAVNMPYVECSAYTGSNIEKVFSKLSIQLFYAEQGLSDSVLFKVRYELENLLNTYLRTSKSAKEFHKSISRSLTKAFSNTGGFELMVRYYYADQRLLFFGMLINSRNIIASYHAAHCKLGTFWSKDSLVVRLDRLLKKYGYDDKAKQAVALKYYSELLEEIEMKPSIKMTISRR